MKKEERWKTIAVWASIIALSIWTILPMWLGGMSIIFNLDIP